MPQHLTTYVRDHSGKSTRLSKQLTAQIVDRAIKEGKRMPLELFIEVMNSRSDPQHESETAFDYQLRLKEHAKLRLEAAKAAAPFVHPRIVSLDPGDSLGEGSESKKLILVPISPRKDSVA